MSDHFAINWQTPGELKDGSIWVQENYSQHGGIIEIVVKAMKYQNGWKKFAEIETKNPKEASRYADNLVKKYGLEKEGDMNESKMADLDLFGEEWSSMSDNFKTNIIKKAGIVLNQLGGKIKTVVNDEPLLVNRIMRSEWRSLPTEIQVKLYQAGRVKEDSEPIWKDTNLRPDNMESKLTEIQASAETESKLKEFYALSQKLATLTKEVKALQSQMGGLEEDITSELERAEDNVLETKKFFAKIQRKGYDRENVKYKEAFDFLLGKVNPALKKIAEDALEATKSISKVKASIAVGQQGKPMMEAVRVWDKIKNILRGIARKIAGVNDYWEQALAQVNAKMVESTVKKTVTELFESGSKE